jgi:hypothetical protein
MLPTYSAQLRLHRVNCTPSRQCNSSSRTASWMRTARSTPYWWRVFWREWYEGLVGAQAGLGTCVRGGNQRQTRTRADDVVPLAQHAAAPVGQLTAGQESM